MDEDRAAQSFVDGGLPLVDRQETCQHRAQPPHRGRVGKCVGGFGVIKGNNWGNPKKPRQGAAIGPGYQLFVKISGLSAPANAGTTVSSNWTLKTSTPRSAPPGVSLEVRRPSSLAHRGWQGRSRLEGKALTTGRPTSMSLGTGKRPVRRRGP